MIVPIEQLDDFIFETLKKLQSGTSRAVTEACIPASLPGEVAFDINIVKSVNAIDRKTIQGPNAESVTESVEEAYVSESVTNTGLRKSTTDDTPGKSTDTTYRGEKKSITTEPARIEKSITVSPDQTVTTSEAESIVVDNGTQNTLREEKSIRTTTESRTDNQTSNTSNGSSGGNTVTVNNTYEPEDD